MDARQRDIGAADGKRTQNDGGDDMTDNEMRIAIAQVCGFKMCPVHLTYECCGKVLPDYLNDLNAMHEVEAKIEADDWIGAYAFELREVTLGPREKTLSMFELQELEPKMRWRELHATARQRAEAFLKTIGKWREKKSHRNPLTP